MKINGFLLTCTLVLISLISLVLIAELTSPETSEALFQEGGLVENLSAVGYFVAFILLIFRMAKQKSVTPWSLATMLLCFGMRELDFDKRFTTMGIFKSRFLQSSEVPINEKIVGTLVIAALLTCIFFLLKTHFRPFITNLKRRDENTLIVFLALGLMVFSKSIDGLSRKLAGIGISTSSSIDQLACNIEESMELMVPILFIVAILNTFRSQKE